VVSDVPVGGAHRGRDCVHVFIGGECAYVLWASALNCVILKKRHVCLVLPWSITLRPRVFLMLIQRITYSILTFVLISHYMGAFRRAPAVATPVVAVLVERIMWWS
jgi:hypothetical protein